MMIATIDEFDMIEQRIQRQLTAENYDDIPLLMDMRWKLIQSTLTTICTHDSKQKLIELLHHFEDSNKHLMQILEKDISETKTALINIQQLKNYLHGSAAN